MTLGSYDGAWYTEHNGTIIVKVSQTLIEWGQSFVHQDNIWQSICLNWTHWCQWWRVYQALQKLVTYRKTLYPMTIVQSSGERGILAIVQMSNIYQVTLLLWVMGQKQEPIPTDDLHEFAIGWPSDPSHHLHYGLMVPGPQRSAHCEVCRFSQGIDVCLCWPRSLHMTAYTHSPACLALNACYCPGCLPRTMVQGQEWPMSHSYLVLAEYRTIWRYHGQSTAMNREVRLTVTIY